jgi:hypothetical protein
MRVGSRNERTQQTPPTAPPYCLGGWVCAIDAAVVEDAEACLPSSPEHDTNGIHPGVSLDRGVPRKNNFGFRPRMCILESRRYMVHSCVFAGCEIYQSMLYRLCGSFYV